MSRRNRPAKPPLSQQTIVDAALTILDDDGLDAVSMRRVAQALDTGAASLYVYVRNRDQLLALLLDRVAGEIPLPVSSARTSAYPGTSASARTTASGTWREQLSTLIAEAISVFGRHRGIATVAFATVPTGPNALALTDTMLGLLAESGISRRAQAWAIDVIALYITASGVEETIYLEAGMKESEAVSELEHTFSALPADDYPHICDLQSELINGSGDERARWGIDVLINGILASQVTPP